MTTHVCSNCDGIGPASCAFNPGRAKWVRLVDLRAGAIFETLEGWRGVKGVKVYQGQLHCTGLKDGVGVYRGGQMLVREIIIKESE